MNPACQAIEQDKEWLSKADWLQRHQDHLAIRDNGPHNILFIGDSITQGWGESGQEIFARDLAPLGIANFGIGGDATEHVLWRIEHGVLDGLSPRKIALLIGTNNLGNEGHSAEQTAAGILAVLAAIQEKCPAAQIIFHAVFPRDNQPGTLFRQQIAEINQRIQQAADGNRVIWFDIGDQFLDDQGEITDSLMPDFLHLTPTAYDIWSKALLPLLA
ncbi:MAG: GDSL family lipase [Planctomycetes bacterium]|nr:GDSL family lipase [Planctomycetota bacterium]